jgi:hypothetical protein
MGARPSPSSASRRLGIILVAASLAWPMVGAPDAARAGSPDAPEDADFSVTHQGDDRHDTGARSIFYGLATGVAGFGFGAVAGAMVYKDETNDMAALEGIVIGGSIAGALTLPLGVHAGNHGRGHFGAVLATSVAVGAAGWVAMYAFEEGAILPVTAAAQLALCTVVEQATTPPRGEVASASPTAVIAPCVIDGRGGLAVAGRF